jgi:hypothetical protein
MARIRTLKPEFPQSESMGNVSRDARLTFIELWTIADDEGRLRGNSRMLASLLFPYDDDAPGLIDNWLGELEREQCIIRYKVDGQSYLQICNWLIHQKIDKPSRSKIPPVEEGSIILAKPRECSSEDQGSRIKDQGSKDHGAEDRCDGAAPPSPPGRAVVVADKKPKADKEPAPTHRIWMHYAEAYERRYGTAPVRNAKVNGQLANLLQRLGAEEAPQVAEWFVGHNNRWYVQQMHSVDCLTKDAEKLRTEWATGRRVTASAAQEADRLQDAGDMWGRIIDQHEGEGVGYGKP